MIIHFRACHGIEARTLPLLGEFSNLHANVRTSNNSGRTPESFDRRKVCNSVTSLVSNDNWEDEMYRRKRSRTSQGSTYDDAYSQLEERKTAPPPMAVPGQSPKVFTQYTGDYSGCTWNAQALFAQQPSSQMSKMEAACKLARRYKILALQETHSTVGTVEGSLATQGNIASLRNTHKMFWSHGTTKKAGVALWVQNSLLGMFEETNDDSWFEIIPGRAARLRLQGPLGALDIYVTYMQVGTDQEDKLARKNTINAISMAMAAREQTLSLIMGDWNFVMDKVDRWSKCSGSWSGSGDALEAKAFLDDFVKPHRLHEWLQPAMTHECSLARSKLDRVYSNHSVSDQLDRAYGCVALPWTACSAHRPVAFSRKTPEHSATSAVSIDAATLADPQFAHRVALEFHEMQANDTRRPSAFRNLLLMKRAIGVVASASKAATREQCATTKEDDLGHVLGFLRAAQKVNLKRMQECAAKYPKILEYVQANNPEARSTSGFTQLKDHAVTLARKQVTEEVEALREASKSESEAAVAHRKSGILAKLKRLLPGAPNSIMAIQCESGDVTSDPDRMAEELRKH